ncbi:hypothetical protein VTN00DRAFT_7396 [Thermoascus crustaceus]|uniref:uncharacterized protein n=1 Tax=Thermoascus crustaceus TaxID=5088 RepID=UPI003743CE89
MINVDEKNSHAALAFGIFLVVYSLGSSEEEGENLFLVADDEDRFPHLIHFFRGGCSMLFPVWDKLADGPLTPLAALWRDDLDSDVPHEDPLLRSLLSAMPSPKDDFNSNRSWPIIDGLGRFERMADESVARLSEPAQGASSWGVAPGRLSSCPTEEIGVLLACAQLLSLGLTHLILAVRNVAKSESARESLLASLPTGSKRDVVIEVWVLDLSDYASIIAFVEKLKKKRFDDDIRLDFAILNAGVASFEFYRNPLTSNEKQVAVADDPNRNNNANDNNYARPVLSIVGSETAAWAKFKEAKNEVAATTSILAALNDEKNFDMRDRYYTSKLLLELFFPRASRPSSSEIIPFRNRVHDSQPSQPGLLLRFRAPPQGNRNSARIIGRSVQVGARTLVHGAVLAGPESNGRYLSPCRVVPFADYAESRKGKIIKREVWDAMVAEVGKVVDIGKVLAEI